VAEAGAQPWLKALENVTFHNKLGSQAERIDRIAALAREIAPLVKADPDLAEAAARFAKADLSSEMVYEFPELQGLMGKYYAGPAGHPVEVAEACVEHYQPLGPSDDVPSAPVSVAVALADKLDTLTGFWAIDEKPTGSKDPFALRRAALGVIRLVLENGVRVELATPIIGAHQSIIVDLARVLAVFDEEVIEKSDISYSRFGLVGFSDSIDMRLHIEELYTEFLPRNHPDAHHEGMAAHGEKSSFTRLASASEVATDLLAFFHDRLKVFLKDRGIRHDVIDACLAMPQNDDLTLLVKRAEALSDTLKTEDGVNLIQGYKRAANILGQAEAADGVEYSYGADVKFAETDAEVALFTALDTAEAAITPALASEDFATAMSAMAGLRAPIDAFFDSVQVNADTDVLRRNRLNLLHRIRATCGQVADLTRIEG